MSQFEKVKDFNKAFGVPVHDTPQKKLLLDKNLIKFRLDLIKEELQELETAVSENDIIETVDALADILYVVHGMGSVLGLDLDKAFDIVHKSNMSKLCKTEKEAQDTVEYYKKNFDKLGYDSPEYRLSNDKKYYIVFNASTTKILKSINYIPADLKYVDVE